MDDRTGSAVLAGLHLSANRSAPATLTNAHQVAVIEAPIFLECEIVVEASQEKVNREYQIFTAFRFPTMEHSSEPQVVSLSPYVEDVSDTASPTSDTILFEDAPVCPISQLGCDEGIRPYTAPDDTSKEEASITWDFQMKDHETIPVAKQPFRHRRYVSSQLSFDAASIPWIPLRSRARTNDGLLLFRANSSKEPTDNASNTRHRRKVSLNLPVNAHKTKANGAQLFQKPDLKSWAKSPANMEADEYAARVDILSAEERDLEYKHRHTFIGTGSLDDFLEILEITPNHTVTKGAITRAFVQLASSEQLYARQSSTKTDGWDLVSRTTSNVVDVTSVDYIVQLKVKLGFITLRQFLDLIPFNESNEVAAMPVVEAFGVASHIDATTDIGTRSKARAFRRWLVEQKEVHASF
jgi:hypothetical protein